MVMCFGGVLLVAFGGGMNQGEVLALGVFLSVLMAWVVSTANLLNRMMSDIPWFLIMFWHAFLGFILTTGIVVVEALIVGKFRMFSYSGRQVAILLLCGFLDISAVSTQVIACQSADLGFISIIGNTIVFYSFLADLLIFQQTLTAV